MRTCIAEATFKTAITALHTAVCAATTATTTSTASTLTVTAPAERETATQLQTVGSFQWGAVKTL